MVEINPDITTDYSHWITNSDVNIAEEQIKYLKASKDWKGFRILPGPPMGNENISVEELRKIKIVGIYAVSDKPNMVEHIKMLKEQEEKWLRRKLNKISASIKAEEMFRV